MSMIVKIKNLTRFPINPDKKLLEYLGDHESKKFVYFQDSLTTVPRARGLPRKPPARFEIVYITWVIILRGFQFKE